MRNILKAALLIFLFCLTTTSVYAAGPAAPRPSFPPKAPNPPQAPKPPELPEFPDRSGVYSVPDRPDILARVFVHSHRSVSPFPVLSCSDPDAQASVSGTGVRLPAGSWTYNLNAASVPNSIGRTNLPTISTNAFAAVVAWQNQVSFIRGSDTTISRPRLDGRNIIAWGRTTPGALGVTYYWYYLSTGYIVETDTIMNTRYVWSWTNPESYTCSQNANSYDAQNILTHELGHWLGLNDEYETAFSDHTMYGYGSRGELKKNTLTLGDKEGIKAIYP